MYIRLPLSIDHQKKKAVSLRLPFSLYLHFVTSEEFEAILPLDLQEKCRSLKRAFYAQNRFFSDEYRAEYERSPYIRFLTGPEVHKFFSKLLSLNYQAQKHVLSAPVGSFEEYFSDIGLFWNEKYKIEEADAIGQELRSTLFCRACIDAQYQRVTEKKNLQDKLDSFVKSELAAKDQKIRQLNRKLEEAQSKCRDLEDDLAREQVKNIVLVPSDPHYMLGLHPNQEDEVEKRAKILLKILHPDKSGSAESGFLFDMVLKARDMILK